ncbi:hypothetical protein QSU92_08080 [Microbacterium sp. ET2]|uniref:hypothetical protein n=1 Tax=Microbacterium albipurpureum TaxID=3050384 RepID=UPI00259C8469|nr:hypothetical protein [Microbacterium sp. ET2 (Ac-2212)]WJL97107.1 hypothetical protein QSU92_08080 [Microbacterium sp. ET2 (Ac-2212)]
MTPDATHEELRRLRERAWGPDADLADDAAALARLRALEAAVHGEVERTEDPGPPAHGSAADAAAPAATPEAPATPATPGPESENRPTTEGVELAASDLLPEAERPPIRAWFPRRRAPWAASLIAAAAIGAVIVVAGATTVERTGGGRQIGTLAPDPGFTPPDFLGIPADSLRGFDEFYGLTVFSSNEEWIGGGTDECLLVVGDGGGEAQRQVFLGCGVGAFAASVSFRVQPRMPAELLERFPEGTPLKFVRQGSDVRVLAGDTP